MFIKGTYINIIGFNERNRRSGGLFYCLSFKKLSEEYMILLDSSHIPFYPYNNPFQLSFSYTSITLGRWGSHNCIWDWTHIWHNWVKPWHLWDWIFYFLGSFLIIHLFITFMSRLLTQFGSPKCLSMANIQ